MVAVAVGGGLQFDLRYGAVWWTILRCLPFFFASWLIYSLPRSRLHALMGVLVDV